MRSCLKLGLIHIKHTETQNITNKQQNEENIINDEIYKHLLYFSPLEEKLNKIICEYLN